MLYFLAICALLLLALLCGVLPYLPLPTRVPWDYRGLTDKERATMERCMLPYITALKSSRIRDKFRLLLKAVDVTSFHKHVFGVWYKLCWTPPEIRIEDLRSQYKIVTHTAFLKAFPDRIYLHHWTAHYLLHHVANPKTLEKYGYVWNKDEEDLGIFPHHKGDGAMAIITIIFGGQFHLYTDKEFTKVVGLCYEPEPDLFFRVRDNFIKDILDGGEARHPRNVIDLMEAPRNWKSTKGYTFVTLEELVEELSAYDSDTDDSDTDDSYSW